MKKDEMERHRVQYGTHMSHALTAEREGRCRDAIRFAKLAWPNVDAMLQFDRRYNQVTHDRVSAIDVVLRWAPVVLDLHSLSAVQNLLDACKRIGRETADYRADLADAHTRLNRTHRLWTCLDKNGDVLEADLPTLVGGDAGKWTPIIVTWERIGLVRRTASGRSHVVGLVTRFGQVVPAKCSSCGTVVELPKSMCFEPLDCHACKSRSDFVIGERAK